MKRTYDRRRAYQLGLLVPALLGLVALGRTAAAYGNSDPLALGLLALMTLGFGAALVELSLRLARALQIEDETGRLPVPATEESVEAASPELRAYLRARIEHAPLPNQRESFTPYLIGVMVMLGLLGTLLGLFDTLRGAGLALTESTNVEALRSGLSSPMRGLTRSFGCSAAGVTASALLGLCSALVRRVESQCLLVVQRYANGPLRELSPTRRQLSALSQIADHGEAWPRAAEVLGRVSQQLIDLSSRWEAAHAHAAREQSAAFVKLAEGVRKDFSDASVDVVKRLEAATQPLITRATSQNAEAASAHFKHLSEALDRDLVARRAADEKLRAALSHELTGLRTFADSEISGRLREQEARSKAFEAALHERAGEQANALALQREQAAAHLRTLESSVLTLKEQLEQAAVAQRSELATIAEGLATQVSTFAEGLSTQVSTVVTGLSTQLSSFAEHSAAALATQAERSATDLATRAERDATVLAQLSEQVHTLTQQGTAELRARAEADAAQAERTSAALSSMHELGEALRTSLERQEAAVSTLVAEAATQLAQAGGSAQVEAQQALERIVSLATEQAERLAGFEQQLLGAQTREAQALSQELAGFAERLVQGVGSSAELVREAASVLKANSVEMGAVAELFSDSVDRQRDAARTWTESLGEVEGAVERAGRGAAAEALSDQLASTQEVFARQLQFQRELFEQLRALRGTPATPTRNAERADVSA